MHHSAAPAMAADAFDPLVVNPGRLSILVALASQDKAHPTMEFVDLRRQTRLTDGNLNCHARRLATGGLIEIAKQFRGDKPVTTYHLTAAGAAALQSHVRKLVGKTAVQAAPASVPEVAVEDDWID